MEKRIAIIGIGILYTCLCFSQKISFSVEETPFCSSVSDEFAPMYYNDGLVFCSNSLSNTSIKSDGGKLFNILSIQKRDSSSWKNPALFSKDLTTILNEGPATFKPDGLTIYYARNNQIEGKFKDINDPSNTMGIFSADFINGVWSNIQPFPYNSVEYSIGTPALSPNGLRIYFASDMPGGLGGTDLYYSDFFSGKWQQPVNLGELINTKGNESYPYINQSGLLFFASDGLPGLGGKDIYYTARLDGEWQPPIHLGADINSKSDDYGLITDINFERGYFSSNRKHSEDIFSFRSEMPQFGYCDTVLPTPQCFAFYDDRFTDTLHLDYEWNFGNGIVKKGYKVEHCYSSPGAYEVLLTIVHKLADSVFETKSVHRFEIDNILPAYLKSDELLVEKKSIKFEAYLKDFDDFRIVHSFWDFGEGFIQKGDTTEYTFNGSGEILISYGLEGEKNNYGIIPRKCFTQPVQIVSDFQELALKNKESIIKSYSEADLVRFDSEFPEDKNGIENYRFDFSILSTNLPILEVDLIEEELSKYLGEVFQLQDEEVTEKSVNTINEIIELLKKYPNQSLVIAIHRDKKGSVKATQQQTDIVAEKLGKLIENKGLSNTEIQCIGYGDKRPLVHQKEKYTRYMNQRIEFIVYSNSTQN